MLLHHVPCCTQTVSVGLMTGPRVQGSYAMTLGMLGFKGARYNTGYADLIYDMQAGLPGFGVRIYALQIDSVITHTPFFFF